jgi:hypothetical protein
MHDMPADLAREEYDADGSWRSAWYWRRRGESDLAWTFLRYGTPNMFWLQREYMEIQL